MSAHSQSTKEEMKTLVIESFTKELKKSSSKEHEDLRPFFKGLEEEQELQLTILTGGLCNYSYKLHFKDNDKDNGRRNSNSNSNNNEIALFVKLTFSTPVLFPDVDCSPERTKYEFKMMDLFAKITPDPKSAVKPYLCFDVEGDSEENMKVLVTQFSSRLEEQAAHVFVDGGTIEKAFATNIANGLAALHNTEVTEPDFNEKIKDFFLTLTGMNRMIFAGYLDETNKNPDRTALRAREIGKENLDKIIDVYCQKLMLTDCYCHGDSQAFNILVEEQLKSWVNEDESTIGDVTFIDWEFSHVGPIGRDIGTVYCFPIACLFAHAINVNKFTVKGILEFLDNVWETYAASIDLESKDLSMEDVYRRVMGFLGIMISWYSAMGAHMNYLPIDEGNTEDTAKVQESLGVLSLEVFEIGFLGAYGGETVEQLRKRFNDALQKEIDHLSPTKPRRQSKRRSSMLRATGRRVSDAHSYFSIATNVKNRVQNRVQHIVQKSVKNRVRFADNLVEYCADGNDAEEEVDIGPRTSIAIVDLKRASICEWDEAIFDFDF